MALYIRKKGWNCGYRILCSDTSILNQLASLYHPDSSKKIPDDGNLIPISIHFVDDHYTISYNQKTIVTDLPIQIIQNIIFEESSYLPSLFPLHGGAIETKGKAHLFLAPTHAGKTTLIAFLTQQGYPYINDDRILIDMDTLCVIPNAAPIHLRLDSVSVLEQYGCSIIGTELSIESFHRIVYFPENIASSELQIGNIFFMERSQTECLCQNVNQNEAVKLLMEGLLTPKAYDGNRLKCAIQLASKCKKLVYSDMRYVADLLDKESL